MITTIPPQKRTHHSQPEFDDQVAVFGWRQYQVNIYPELKYMFSTLNGVRVSIGLATKMKRAGMTRGVVDIILPAKNKYFAGLFIELKHGDNKPSNDQKEYLAFLNLQGYFATVCNGSDDAIRTIEYYLNRIERSK
ncbi:MAG: VRR-NUC domain-containing protein [Chloroflexi bacterium HGW-Chloroflexi-8]|nr:MAG: VRR-NUC domain-containing protein [Chloroflexi bacterium HGW-Chloroflexi-8]